jgi:hypothetical protein
MKEQAMRNILPLLASAALLAAGSAQARERPTPEAEIAQALEGRIAGEPVSCVNLRNVRSTRIISDTAILYEAGGTIYLNRPRAGADALNRWDTMVTRPFGTRLCNTDVVRMIDPSSHMLKGLVFLDEFVPYRRVQQTAR